MEIHRRSRATTSNATAPHSNGSSNAPRQRGGRASHGPPVKARPLAENPYAAQTTLADVFLLRSIQLLLLLAATWFVYLIVANPTDAEDDVLTIAGGVNDEGGNSLRGGSPKSEVLRLPKDLPAFSPDDAAAARARIKLLRDEFHQRYGGEGVAKEMLRRGVRTFERKGGGGARDEPAQSTADRFLGAILRHEAQSASSSPNGKERPEFVMAFAGYSVTVGRGNHLEQSFPFVLHRVLSPILELPPFNTKLVVRNSAIGGIPSFPYGWCLSNFLGVDADLVSWDYGMNEGNGASGLESYLRQSLILPKAPPLFVMLDMKRPRLDLLQKYVDMGALPDPIALAGRDAVDKKLLQLPEEQRPPGLQKWDEWGAPKGAPGQSPWHPKKMEHELMGWMLAIHMLDALDAALDKMERNVEWRDELLEKEQQKNRSSQQPLPPPVTDVSKSGAASMLHGVASESDKSEWHMNHISCRTSFLPNIAGDLNSIIESGVTIDEEDMLQPRDDSLFNGGWVMDVGKLERDTKLKVMKYGGLGYIDMKTALYGLPSSGTLKLWLPYEGRGKSAVPPEGDDSASKYFNSIIICEVNEKRGDKECRMTSDLSFHVGGATLSKSNVKQVKDVASYLKKEICVHLDIPEESKLSSKNEGVGVTLDVSVTRPDISRENGACSVSHVIWENK